jgi:hypothetical protein
MALRIRVPEQIHPFMPDPDGAAGVPARRLPTISSDRERLLFHALLL